MNELEFYKEVSKAYNNLDYTLMENVFSDEVVYESQNVFSSLNGKNEVVDYLKGKFKAISSSKNLVFAELGYLPNNKPCIILSQGSKENKGSVVLLEIENQAVARIDICTVAPHWSIVKPTGGYYC